MNRPAGTPWSSDLEPGTMLACGVIGLAVVQLIPPAIGRGLNLGRSTALIVNLVICLGAAAVMLAQLYRHRLPEEPAQIPLLQRLKRNIRAILCAVVCIEIGNLAVSILWQFALDAWNIPYENTQWMMKAARENNGTVFWLICLNTLAACPLVEELIFRRMLYGALLAKLKVPAAVAATNIIFAAIHSFLLGLPGLFVMGLGFHAVYLHTRSLISAMIVHCAVNAIALAPLISANLT